METTDTLTVVGTASKDDYEKALESVTFSATTLGLLGRTVSIDVVDDSNEGVVPGHRAGGHHTGR